MDPPRSRSSKATRRPARLSRYAAVTPVRPAPTTTTSTCRSRSSAANFGIRVFCQYGDVSISAIVPRIVFLNTRRALAQLVDTLGGLGFGEVLVELLTKIAREGLQIRALRR